MPSRTPPTAAVNAGDNALAAKPGLWDKISAYFALIKSRQTLLLYATGICAYLIAMGGHAPAKEVLAFSAALLLSISGCTAFNMILDRDIDARMERTHERPLVAGRLDVRQALIFAILLSAAGLGLAFWLRWQSGLIIALGFVFDLGIYTGWLKRRTPLSILFGGIAGGMPALAGRVLALGHIDLIGILLALSILLWIPSHIITLSIKYRGDYDRGGVPVWPNVYGERSARLVIATANLLNAVALLAGGVLLGIAPWAILGLALSALAMIALAIWGILRPTEEATWLLFKAASMYMLLSFLLITFGAIL